MLVQKSKKYADDIAEAISSLFDEENENFKYKLDDIDPTAFFTGFSLAFGYICNRLTDMPNENICDITYIQNKLLFQFLVELKKQEGK